MNSTSSPESNHPPSRWKLAQDTAGGGATAATALRELAESYWYCVYAWWRRAGLDAPRAPTATLASFSRWLSDAAPQATDSGSARLREWLPARLAELSVADVKLRGEPLIAIDRAWAEARYADEPEGDTDAIFQRRWALTILEFTTKALQAEYSARGEDKLFEELLAFAGFEPSDDERYATAASRTGRTSGAMRKAVFDFRTRHRELLRGFVADTVVDPGDIESEITALLLACDAVGPQGAAAPLPTVLKSVQPDQVLARSLDSVKMSSGGANGWTPPTVQEAARLFPNYEVLSLLGRGGMGAVYKACQTSLDRLVAIKLLPLEISVDKEFADRFRREARAMAKLSHPNIISVHDFGQTSEGHLYFVMEFIDGAMLHTLIHGRKGDAAPDLPAAEALALAGQVCDALAYAHEQGVIHRDIKPANVMVDRHGKVKVADFGLARMAEADPSQWGTTMTGVVMGTPDYMSPEQKRGMHVDHRADIYSLGVMLYEMLCKEKPHGVFKLPSKHSGLDKRLDVVITKALASKPEERFQSTAEMKAAIEIIRPAVAKAQAKKPKPLPKPAPAKPAPAPHDVEPPDSVLGNAETALAHSAEASVHKAGKNRRNVFSAVAIGLAAIVALTLFVIPKLRHGNAPAPEASVQRTDAALIAATKDAPFVNSLGMKFVPVPVIGGPTNGQRVLFSIWDTRVQDYEVFARETKSEWPKVDFLQGPTHPAVNVTWENADAFCSWLSARDRRSGSLPADWRYRLPSDHEWSCAAGIGERENAAKLPVENNESIGDVFPWGKEWPPPRGAGNYAGEELRAALAAGKYAYIKEVIGGYEDGFVNTSPVGSFAANWAGLFDFGGNTWQWCQDFYDKGQKEHILRGGAWNTGNRSFLLSAKRFRAGPESFYINPGFRCVLSQALINTAAALEPGAIKLWDSPEKLTGTTTAHWEDGAVRLDGGLPEPHISSRDGILRARVKRNKDAAATQISLRIQNGSYYRLTLQFTNAELFAIIKGAPMLLAHWPLPREFGPDEWPMLEFKAVGNELSASIDGYPLGSIRDDSIKEAGSVTLFATRAGYFRDVVYEPLDKPGSAPTDLPLVGWQPAITDWTEIKTQKGITLLHDGWMRIEGGYFHAQGRRDVALRSQMRFLGNDASPLKVRERNPPGEFYAAGVSADGADAVLWRQISGSDGRKPLATGRLNRKLTTGQEYELSLAAIGDQLSVYLDGKSVIQVRDAALTGSTNTFGDFAAAELKNLEWIALPAPGGENTMPASATTSEPRTK